jgi:hypothetical protein
LTRTFSALRNSSTMQSKEPFSSSNHQSPSWWTYPPSPRSGHVSKMWDPNSSDIKWRFSPLVTCGCHCSRCLPSIRLFRGRLATPEETVSSRTACSPALEFKSIGHNSSFLELGGNRQLEKMTARLQLIPMASSLYTGPEN